MSNLLRTSFNSDNVPVLNTLRAIAAISVCLYHFVYTTTDFISNKNVLSFFYFGKFGVHMFFVISGFVIPWSMYRANYKYKNIFLFLLKRIVRLEPPYLFSLLAVVIIIVLRQSILGNFDLDFSATQLLLHFGYLIPFFENFKWLNQVYWTLAVEFQYYILIALIYPFFVNKNKYFRYILYFVFALSGFSSNLNFLPHWLPLFLLGIIVFLKLKNLIASLEAYLVMVSVLSVIFIQNEIGVFLFVLITLVVLLFFAKEENAIGNFVGEFSYSIYLIHGVIGAAFINYFSHGIDNPWMKIALIIAGLLITFVFSYLMYRLVEKPSKKISSKIKY